jgi:hypothetical protein
VEKIAVISEQDAVVLLYRTRRFGMEGFRQRVAVTWTDCALGGRRPWFVCWVNRPHDFAGDGSQFFMQRAIPLHVGSAGVFLMRASLEIHATKTAVALRKSECGSAAAQPA